jgi:hypothetical protein
MTIIFFANQQSYEVLKKKRYQDGKAESCGINKI